MAFQPTIRVSTSALLNIDNPTTFQTGQWIIEDTDVKGQYIGMTPNGTVYVCWQRQGESRLARGQRLAAMVQAYKSQCFIEQRRNAITRPFYNGVRSIYGFLAMVATFLASFFTVGYSRESLAIRASRNNLVFVFQATATQPYRFVDKTCGYNVIAAATEQEAHELLDNYSHIGIERKPIQYARVIRSTVQYV